MARRGEVGPSLLFGERTNLTASATPFASIGFFWTGLRVNFTDPKGDDALLELITGVGYPIPLDRGLR